MFIPRKARILTQYFLFDNPKLYKARYSEIIIFDDKAKNINND